MQREDDYLLSHLHHPTPIPLTLRREHMVKSKEQRAQSQKHVHRQGSCVVMVTPFFRFLFFFFPSWTTDSRTNRTKSVAASVLTKNQSLSGVKSLLKKGSLKKTFPCTVSYRIKTVNNAAPYSTGKIELSANTHTCTQTHTRKDGRTG